MKLLPQARNSALVVQELGAELLVYDLNTDQAYQLNKSLLIVFQACDGRTSFNDLKRKYNFTDDLIYLALAELNAANLLVNYDSHHFAGLSRREVVKRVGLACAAALPIIVGITAPAAIDAASGASAGLAANATCTSNEQCSSNRCVSTKTLTITADGTASSNRPSGKQQCCVPGTVGTPDSDGSTYPARDQFSCGILLRLLQRNGISFRDPEFRRLLYLHLQLRPLCASKNYLNSYLYDDCLDQFVFILLDKTRLRSL